MSPHQVIPNDARCPARLGSEPTFCERSIHQPAMYLQRRILIAFAALATTIVSLAAQTSRNSPTPAEVKQAIDQIRAPQVDDKVLTAGRTVSGVLLSEGRYAEAAELLTVIAGKKPNDARVIYAEALAIFNTGRVSESEPLARRAVELARISGAPADPARAQMTADALVLLGVILAVRGDDAAAVKAEQEATRIAPNHFDAQFALGRALFGMGDDSGAARAFRAARTLQPANAQVLFFLATVLERAGEINEALATYRELIALRPEMFEGHLGLGALLLKRGGTNADEGLSELKRALQIDPNLYEAQVAIGRALISGGHPAEAISYLQRAAELAPNNPEPHYQLSLAYRRLGRKQEAADEAAIVKRIHESRRGTKVVTQSRMQ